jgi:hypothetical protein
MRTETMTTAELAAVYNDPKRDVRERAAALREIHTRARRAYVLAKRRQYA